MIGSSGLIKCVICGLLCFGVGVVILNFSSHNSHPSNIVLPQKAKIYEKQKSVSRILNKIVSDFKSDNKPGQLTVDNSKNTTIRKYKISKNQIFVRESGRGKYHILLLHGQGSSSKVWEDIGTLRHLSNWGYRAFAIDIPSSGNRSLPVEGDKEAVQWITDLIDTLGLKNLVIISPSMSGRLTLPYIFQLKQEQKLIRGFVPIAPVGTDKIKPDDYKKIKIPTLIVHGEKDSRFQLAFENLKNIPASEILLIKNASHACYIEKPMEFHNHLRQFLYKIYRPIFKSYFELPKKQLFLSNATKNKTKSAKPLQQ